MATGKVMTIAAAEWADVAGAAASVAGVTWQCLGPDAAAVAFSTLEPGAATAVLILQPGNAFYDKNGSAHFWAQARGPAGVARLSAVAD